MGVALAAPLAASAQQRGRKYRVGLALPPGEDLNRRMRGAVADRLASHGFVEGKNLEIRASVMSTTGGYYTRETVRAVLSQKPDVVLVFSTQFAHAFQQETATVPVVFTQVSDALAAGLVKNLARPGGNMTGVSTRHAELAVK